MLRARPLVTSAALAVLAAGAALSSASCSSTQHAGRTRLVGVGEPAPDFSAPDQTGRTRTLAELRGRPIVLYFYPRDATPGCTREACAFRDAWERLQAAGAAVVGVSTDDVESHRAFAREHHLPFPLLADVDSRILHAYGVSSTMGMAQRVTFIIGRDGRVARVWPEVDPGVHATEVLAALAELR